MNRYGVLSNDAKTVLGYIKAKDFTEAKALVKNKVPLIYPDFTLKDITIGFSDQYVVEETSFTVNSQYDAKTAIVLQQMLFLFDETIGWRLVSSRDDFKPIPVYAFDFESVKSYIEHERNLPGVLTLPSLGSEKEHRHWYFTGWVYYYLGVKYYRVWNAITKKLGFVQAGGKFYFQKTALETNFGVLQKNLNDIEKGIYDNIIVPAKEGLDYFKNLGYVSLLLGSLYLLSKTDK